MARLSRLNAIDGPKEGGNQETEMRAEQSGQEPRGNLLQLMVEFEATAVAQRYPAKKKEHIRERRRIMARAGDEMVNEVTGLRTIFRKTAADTGGELLQVDWIVAPGWTAGPKHVHRKQLERFTVISGALGVHVDGAERVYLPGAVAEAPAGAVHTAWNAGGAGEEVHALVEFEPALKSDVPLETLAGLAHDGKVNKAGVPKNPFRLALLVRVYEDELYLASPPLFVQRAIFGPLAFVGPLLGYRAKYPYPFAELPGPKLRDEKEAKV